MNLLTFSDFMKDKFNEIKRIRNEGQKEYAHTDDDVFANFNRVSSHLKLEKEEVLMVYLLKHIDGISSYVKGHTSQREDISGRITDAIVYLFLLWGMIEDTGIDTWKDRIGDKP